MVAPVDSKATLEVEGETLTFRLNFRSIAKLEDAGLDLFSPNGFSMTLARSAIMCRCLTITDHPDMTDEEALSYVVRAGSRFPALVLDLVGRFGGRPDKEVEGNVKAGETAAS